MYGNVVNGQIIQDFQTSERRRHEFNNTRTMKCGKGEFTQSTNIFPVAGGLLLPCNPYKLSNIPFELE